jgi:hydroxyacyl-ACP dehydratase HTD2-like protein with hotdog domain
MSSLPRQGEDAPVISALHVRPDPLQLFCFSAVTWNLHRIHYDLAYTRDTENLADLVVPGPMQGAWLLEVAAAAAASWQARVASFSYRNTRVVYARQSLTMDGTVTSAHGTNAEVALWVQLEDGTRTCEGVARLRRPDSVRQQADGPVPGAVPAEGA